MVRVKQPGGVEKKGKPKITFLGLSLLETKRKRLLLRLSLAPFDLGLNRHFGRASL